MSFAVARLPSIFFASPFRGLIKHLEDFIRLHLVIPHVRKSSLGKKYHGFAVIFADIDGQELVKTCPVLFLKQTNWVGSGRSGYPHSP
ncbi:hypothetical protein MSSIH_1852 [Methanosarcina siciliae HI350]|uniref:Uncharacterized protein n=1 Tax=Methanosarcina siciliae HI350 TaxID=1434119 RepID=A0A0E3PEH5_9EURY|nr:hypothetical protein MSSIH_1852 [Methanosarcina siciliae HI350]